MKVIKDEYDEIILLCSPGNQYAGPESYFNKQFSNGARWIEAEKRNWIFKITE
jgi:hypothetical protein